MVEIKGEKCPVCGEAFTDEDDIVFCPECGTPHHRKCYRQLGHCINADKHGEGYAFHTTPPAPPKSEEAGADGQKADKIVCMSCGRVNPAQDIFCEQCGAPLHEGAPRTAQQGPAPGGMGVTMFGEVLSPDEEFDGVRARDWATYIGQSAPYYLSFFKHKKQRNGKGVHFVFSALVFGPYYFLYRKMWLVGGLLLALLTLLEIPTTLAMMASYEMLAVSDTVLSILLKVQFVCSFVAIAIKLIASFFAIDWYQKYGAKQIKKMKEKAADEAEFQQQLVRHSGPSKVVLYIGVGLLLLNSFMSMWLLGFGI